MPVHAVIRGIQPAAGEPFPEWRVARVQRRVPGRIPAQQVRVLLEAIGEPVLAEPVRDRWVGRIGLRDETLRRIVILLLAPVHRNLRLRDLRPRTFCHCSSSSRKLNPANAGSYVRKMPAATASCAETASHTGRSPTILPCRPHTLGEAQSYRRRTTPPDR